MLGCLGQKCHPMGMPLTPWLLLIILLISPLALGQAQTQTRSTYNILILNSWHKDLPWQLNIERGIRNGLTSEPQEFQFYSEYLDIGRFSEGDQQKIMRDYLQQKYNDKWIDIVVTEGFAAASFLRSNADLFAGIHRIYVDPGTKSKDWEQQKTVFELFIPLVQDIKEAIAEMLRLTQPDHVFIIANSHNSDERRRLNAAKATLATLEVKTDHLVDLPLDMLLKKVSQLPLNSAIFYLPIYRDGKGSNILPFQAAKFIAEHANAPIFSQWSTLMGSGITGGYMLSGEQVGQMAGQQISNLLSGRVNTKPLVTPYGYYYDWRQLKRWGIDIKLLPAQAHIQFYTPTFFDQYFWEIIITLTSLCLFSLLSVVLLIVNRKRTWAVKALRTERQSLEIRVDERTKELNHAKQHAEHLAKTDALSELNNRRAFFDYGDAAFAEAQSHNHDFTISLIDIDYFKRINDNHGHAVGDEVIKLVAKAIKRSIRAVDICARIGGEEFAIILTDTPRHSAEDLAERLRQTIEDMSISLDSAVVKVTVSIGVAQYNDDDDSLHKVLERADNALYLAKGQGRNKVAVSA